MRLNEYHVSLGNVVIHINIDLKSKLTRNSINHIHIIKLERALLTLLHSYFGGQVPLSCLPVNTWYVLSSCRLWSSHSFCLFPAHKANSPLASFYIFLWHWNAPHLFCSISLFSNNFLLHLSVYFLKFVTVLGCNFLKAGVCWHCCSLWVHP